MVQGEEVSCSPLVHAVDGYREPSPAEHGRQEITKPPEICVGVLRNGVEAGQPLIWVMVDVDDLGVWVQLYQLSNELITGDVGDGHEAARLLDQFLHQARIVVPGAVHFDPFFNVFCPARERNSEYISKVKRNLVVGSLWLTVFATENLGPAVADRPVQELREGEGQRHGASPREASANDPDLPVWVNRD